MSVFRKFYLYSNRSHAIKSESWFNQNLLIIIMNRSRTLLYGLLLGSATAFGGTFTADFSTQDTSSFLINGSGTLSDGNGWIPIIATNRLVMTVNQNNLSGSFSPYDFDSGAPI